MYADDMIIVSTSENGLQNSLNKLHEYCNKWKLKVNVTKSKVMVFNKTGKMYHTVFKYSDCIMECVRNYKDFDIPFSINASFTEAEQYLKK